MRTWSLALGAAGLALGALGWTVTQSAGWSLSRARALQEAGHFSDSLPELRRALARDPESPEARFRFGLAMLRSGEPFRALWPLQGAAASADYAFAAGRLLVSAYLQTDNYDQAVRVADGLLSEEPENAELRSLRARAQLLARRSEAALRDTRWLHAREPSNFEIAALHAAALVGAGEIEEARQAYEELKALGLESEDPDLQALACVAPAGFADEYLLDGESALRLYEECEESSPDNRLALQLLVSFLQRSGQPERATRLLRDSASAAPGDLGVQWLLARSLSESGDNDGAEAVLQEAAASNGSHEAWRLLAEHQRATGAPRRALASLEAALAATSEDPAQLRFQRADLLIDLGEFERAETAVRGLEPGVFEQLILGRSALLQGDAARALAHLESGLATWPDHVQARQLAGQAAQRVGNLERALSHLREALRGDPSDPALSLELARLLVETGQHEEALGFAANTQRLADGPSGRRAGLVAAAALVGLGHDSEARRVLETLAGQGAAHERGLALAGLAHLELRAGRVDRAIETLDRAEAVDAASGRHAYEATQIALQAGKYALAEQRLRTLAERHPELLEARNDLAWLLAERGADLDLALKLAQDAQAGLEDPRTLDTLGWVHLKRGEYRQAMEALEEALSLRPDSAPTRERLALAMRAAAGDASAASAAKGTLRSEATFTPR